MMDQVRQVSEFNGGSVDSGRSFGNHDDAWSNASPVPEVHDEKMAASYRLPSPTASESSSEACKSQKPVLDAHQQQQAAMAPPSPVASHHSPSDTDAASPSALWCPTPPSDSHNHLPLAATPTPHHPNDHDDAFFMSHSAATAEPAAVLKTPAKYDQTIRGYELWTSEDDVLLLQHVLSRLQLGNWRELEAKFHGRHTARLCSARWYYLRDQLLRGIAKST
ncbi:hypothetical protein BC940DRAFT_33633 [Gongronella butleri]|nr:hypothetical protein BC940DRAFT_33633 [Gongronella butleri]